MHKSGREFGHTGLGIRFLSSVAVTAADRLLEREQGYNHPVRQLFNCRAKVRRIEHNLCGTRVLWGDMSLQYIEYCGYQAAVTEVGSVWIYQDRLKSGEVALRESVLGNEPP